MKIVYCIHSTYNSGGMEKILSEKANFLVEKFGHTVTIVTVNQKARPSFFKFSSQILFFDLNINYNDDDHKFFLLKVAHFIIKRRKHNKKLSDLLLSLKPDITISMFGNEASFICDTQDGSKKILEIHFSKFFRLQSERSGLWRLADYYRSKQDEKLISKFNKFVVLTEEDKTYWSNNADNIIVIPNCNKPVTTERSTLTNKKVISVGRYTFQKGFDMLIDAWQKVNCICPEWKLEIVGAGEDYEKLANKIKTLKLSESVKLKSPTRSIQDEYLSSSIYALSSRFEGLPMVLLEAMSYGIPVVAFKCKCGPKDLINDGEQGLLIEENDIEGLSDGIITLIKNEKLRLEMGSKAYLESPKYAPENVMEIWNDLFTTISNNKE